MKKNPKINNLLILKKNLNRFEAIIPKFIFINYNDYIKDSQKYLNLIKLTFLKKEIILRSASQSEDGSKYSNAGKFLSLVSKVTSEDLKKNINRILQNLKPKDKIIIQEYINNPEYSGVIFTRDLNDNSPYYTLNIDTSKKTNLITSGYKNDSMKTYVIHRSLKYSNKKFIKILKVTKKIEKIFKKDRLDIEFAFKKNSIYIFQCRELNFNKKIKNINLDNSLKAIEKKINKLTKPLPNIYGRANIFSNMADWNPAEIIGVKPKQLALSLYQNLITDNVWSMQRSNFGYKDVKPYPLMFSFGSSPYIDVRTDLNSFLIKDLKNNDGEKIINYYLNKIIKNPKVHDKIENEIFPTYFSFNKKKYLELKKIIGKKNLSSYKKTLKEITLNNFLSTSKNNYESSKILELKKNIDKIKKLNLSLLHKIFLTVNYCKNLGTISFASMARKAFIATGFIDDLNKIGILNARDVKNLYSSIQTVSKNIQNDLLLLKKKNISKKLFLKKYGHLRPSTYSINSKNYQDGYNDYFNLKNNTQVNNKKFTLEKYKLNKIDNLLKVNSFQMKSKNFIKYLQSCIEERERFKLIFTIAIDDIFSYLKKMGKRLKLSSSDLEFLDIDILIKSFSNLNFSKLEKIIKENIKLNKYKLSHQSYIKLPDVIVNSKDIYFFEKLNMNGNFVTQKTVTGKMIIYKNKLKNLNGKIIVLQNADPGYDFIFSHNIKGLITKYGGPNSHMAIRCAEHQIPAIIGMTNNYEDLKDNQSITIDCFQKKIFRHE